MDEIILQGPQGSQLKIEKDKPSRRGDLIKEVGGGGVAFYDGIITSGEFNKKLSGSKGIETYDQMRRTDAQVAALINATQLPILSGTWTVGRPDDQDLADEVTDEHLEFAERNMFTHLNFPAFMRHLLSCIWAGFSWFEKVYKVEDGQLIIGDMSGRLASTVYRWNVDDAGQFIGVTQEYYKDGRTVRVDIPRDKCALFSFQQEGNNFEGMSLLRAVYKHWFIKDQLYRIDAIRHERYAIGVPVITIPDLGDNTAYELATKIGENWKGAEQSYVVKPEGWEIEILQISGGESLDVVPTIQHHNEEIAKAGLAQFINFGTTQSGSRALGESSQEFFYNAMKGIANWAARMINEQVLWPLMDLNFASKPRPVMKVSDIEFISLAETLTALRDVGDLYIGNDLELENHIRERLHLPLRDEDSVITPPNVPPRDQIEPDAEDREEDEENLAAHRGHGHTFAKKNEHGTQSGFWRELTAVEEHIALRQIAGKLDDTKARIMRVMLKKRDKWANQLAEDAEALIADGPNAINRLAIPKNEVRKLNREVFPILKDLFTFGRERVTEELKSQAEEAGIKLSHPNKVREGTILDEYRPVMEKIRTTMHFRDEDEDFSLKDSNEAIRAQIAMSTDRLARRVTDSARTESSQVWRTQGTDIGEEEIVRISTVVRSAVEKETQMMSNFITAVSLNLGRNFQAQKLRENIDVAIYSAVLDEQTCDPCGLADGFETTLQDPAYYDVMPPLSSNAFGACAGMGQCRCIWTYIIRPPTRDEIDRGVA